MARFWKFALLGGLFLGVPYGYAEEQQPPARFQLGFVEVRPAVNFSTVYDDNVFKVSEEASIAQPTRDIYLQLHPRVELRIPYERSHVAAGYGWQGFKYLDAFDTAADTTIWDTFNTHTFFGEASLKLGRGLGLGVRDDFERKSLFITSVDIANVNPDDRDALRPITLYQNEFKPTVAYNFTESNLQLDGGYSLTSDRFPDEAFRYLDKHVHVPRGKVSYRFFPKTAAFVEGDGLFVRYLNRPGARSFVPLDKRNASGWKGWLGTQGAITSRLTLIVAGGWGRLDYEEPSALRGEDANTWLAKVEAREKFSERTKLTLGATRDFFDSYSTNYYTTARAYGELWRSLTPTLAAIVGGNYFRNHYSRPFARSDSGFLASAKLELAPLDREWLKLSGGYNREQRASSLAWYTYQTNQVFVEAAAEF